MHRLLSVRAGAILAAAVAVLGTGGAAQAATKPVVTGNVQVTDNPNPVRAHELPQIVRNPKSGELVVAEADGRGDPRACVVHISTDNGRSWAQGGDMMVKPYTDCSIGAEFGPVAMPFFDKNGVLYVAFTANDPAALLDSNHPRTPTDADLREDVLRNAYLARSTDGGRTFTTTLVHAGQAGSTQTGYVDAPSGAVDPVNPQYVYVGFAVGDWANEKDPIKTMVSASADGGKTFAAPVEINGGMGADYSWVTVDGKGAVHATYWSRGAGQPAADPTQTRINGRAQPTGVYMMNSTDHGKTYTRVLLDPGNQRIYRAPALYAIPTPGSETVYAVWYGFPDPMNFQANKDGKDRTDIYFKSSTDGGKTWSSRVTVNDDPNSGIQHELPGISVAPGGRIDVAWYDYRFTPQSSGNSGLQDVFYSSSTDGGKTWSKNVRITDRSIDRTIGVYGGAIGASVNVGVASTDAAAFFAWSDSRNGRPATQSEDIYSASIQLNGTDAATEPAATRNDNWAILFVGIALGAGVCMAVVWFVARRPGAGSGSGSGSAGAQPVAVRT